MSEKILTVFLMRDGRYVKEEDYNELETELNEAKTDLTELQSLFDLQHKRSLEAMKLWQDAHNEPRAWPDLGKLLEWLMKLAQSCYSCKHGPKPGSSPRRCAGCVFAIKNPADGKNMWEGKVYDQNTKNG